MAALHRSRTYADVNANRPVESLNRKYFQIIWSKCRYWIYEEVGRGGFGSVYKCKKINDGKICAAKVWSRWKCFDEFKNEVMILTRLQGLPNIIRLYGAVKMTYVGGPALILEYIDPFGYRQMAFEANPDDIRFYMRELLIAIDACHRNGIMHRDIKPDNLLIDLSRRRLRLIDFSSATYYLPGKWNSLHVGTRNYQAPELLLGYRTYDYSLDMWAFGCVFAELIFKFERFFNGEDRSDALLDIMRTLGTSSLLVYLAKYNITITSEVRRMLRPYTPISLYQFLNSQNEQIVTEHSLNLLQSLLIYDHQVRLTAKEALEHSYFQEG
nr:casein kinase ii subunit alpha [Hymenolepis microstoma]